MKINVHNYPYNRDFAFTIAIDDLHPESHTDAEKLNFGSSTTKVPLSYIAKAIQDIPEIKFTLFTVANWIDRSDLPSGMFFPLRKLYRKRREYSADSFNIANKTYAKWVTAINSFHPQSTEIALHGLYHHTNNTKFARSQEFGGLSFSEVRFHIKEMFTLFKKSGIHFSKGFRPPGWFMSREIEQELKKENGLYIAPNSDMSSLITEKNSFVYKYTERNGLIRFSANCYPQQVDRAIEIARKEGILMVHMHIVSTEWGLIAINKNFSTQMQTMKNEIRNQTGKSPWFATLEELATFLLAKKETKIKTLSNNQLQITNNSSYDLHGLTLSINNKPLVVKKVKANSTIIISPFEKIEKEKVSIVLTVYNGEKMVLNALDSLSQQTYLNTEIIVVNDGSTDNTKKVVGKYINESRDSRITLISQANRGRANAKNVGLKMATGTYVTFCEDDAIYVKEYISSIITTFKDKNVLGVIGPHYVLNRTASLNTRVKDLERRKNFHNYRPTSCWIYRREQLNKIGGFNEQLEFGEDTEPAQKLKLLYPNGKFAFEERALWLHTEPVSLQKYLIRKFKGGVGMALLKKLGIKKSLFPMALVLPILSVGVTSLAILLYLVTSGYASLSLFMYLLASILLGSFVIRFKDVIKGITVSNEPLYLIILGIYIEYIWWGATFLGILKGMTMTESAVRDYLRGR